MMDAQIKEPAMFAVDCNGRLAIDADGMNVALAPSDVLRLMDFLGAITYKGLVKRTDCAGMTLAQGGDA